MLALSARETRRGPVSSGSPGHWRRAAVLNVFTPRRGPAGQAGVGQCVAETLHLPSRASGACAACRVGTRRLPARSCHRASAAFRSELAPASAHLLPCVGQSPRLSWYFPLSAAWRSVGQRRGSSESEAPDPEPHLFSADRPRHEPGPYCGGSDKVCVCVNG